MTGEPIVLPLHLTPDPDAALALERKFAAVVPPAKAVFHKDVLQPRLPMLLRRQAG